MRDIWEYVRRKVPPAFGCFLMDHRFFRVLVLSLMAASLSACAFERAETAAQAKRRMLGMPMEQVLACMGPPRQKSVLNNTEVWIFGSGNGRTSTQAYTHRERGDAFGLAEREKSFCTVNVVMRSGVVSAVHYNGPRGGWLTPDEQCAYAVEHCAE